MKDTLEQDIIERLRDDQEYYGSFGQQYMSNSDIKSLLSNPLDFRKPQGDNKAFEEGRYFHQSILEPDKAKVFKHVDVASRNTKAYKEYIQDSNKTVVLLTKEKNHVDNMVSKMKSNIDFFEGIYSDGNKFEVPAVTKIMGIDFKGKADIVCNDCLIDLKTTSDIYKFRYSANTYNYDSQCYIYQLLFGKPLKFYVIDKQTFLMGIFSPSQEFVDRGKEKVYKAIQVYEKFYGENPTEDVASYFIRETL